MYGAILGDIIGSPYESRLDLKTKDFTLFPEKCQTTDDSILTIAIAQAILLLEGREDLDEFYELVHICLRKWGNDYCYKGYGGSFLRWLIIPDPEPYNSWGNGSAMRVSAVGWAFDSMEKTRAFAKASAEVTHNHPEGIKGAEATAAAIYMARTGSSKPEIKEYIQREFQYDLDRTIDAIRPGFQMYESCQQTVPESIIAFLESDSFEDSIRNAVSLGGDTDTLGAITGSIAEAYYGVSDELKAECRKRMDDRMIEVIDLFDQTFIGGLG